MANSSSPDQRRPRLFRGVIMAAASLAVFAVLYFGIGIWMSGSASMKYSHFQTDFLARGHELAGIIVEFRKEVGRDPLSWDELAKHSDAETIEWVRWSTRFAPAEMIVDWSAIGDPDAIVTSQPTYVCELDPIFGRFIRAGFDKLTHNKVIYNGALEYELVEVESLPVEFK